MASPLIIHPDCTLLLPMRYFGSVEYYAAMAEYGRVIVDTSMPFDKRQKDTHRCTIADTRGPLKLTAAIEKPVSMTGACWSDIRLSAHGAWWNVHYTALESAYGRTPFFEFYKDLFAPFFNPDVAGTPLADFNRCLDETIRTILGLQTEVTYGATIDFKGPADDFRRRPIDFVTGCEYYQVRGGKFGFLPSLSILDLIFNMGPESPLILKSMQGCVTP